MDFQTLTDDRGRTIGRLTTDHDGEQRMYDEHGRSVGRYNPVTNVTSDAFGRRVGQGNLLAALLGKDCRR